ncbi:hypothetical protein GCM10010276_12270 [Streptomyces longisporus]|uniref:Uncharacterized protein n=1 Tax=Streptomyces longisporus TaxID=1948 RepID=A0ABP5YC50_STRLO
MGDNICPGPEVKRGRASGRARLAHDLDGIPTEGHTPTASRFSMTARVSWQCLFRAAVAIDGSRPADQCGKTDDAPFIGPRVTPVVSRVRGSHPADTEERNHPQHAAGIPLRPTGRWA